MPLNDAHCHFFSPRFFEALSAEKRAPSPAALAGDLGWEYPETAESLADRWVAELDRHGVSRATLIASVPGDEDSVAAAVARHPTRLVGFFMLNPASADAAARVGRAVGDLALRGICLFPAMHRYRLDDDAVVRVVEKAAERGGTAVFVHCGVLSVGVRKKLGLPSPFDIRLGQPLDLVPLAARFPSVPFIVPHFGAGFFREALMAADVRPNIYLDTSSSNAWIKYSPGLDLASVFRQALAVVGAGRLLFGTDSSFFPRGWQAPVLQAQREVVEALGLPPADRDAIFGGTYDTLFGM